MRVGVLGAGQLGRMLALAGIPLGLEFVFYDNNPRSCAAGLGEYILGEFDDPEALRRFAHAADIVTLEFEAVPLNTLQHLAQQLPVYPPLSSVEIGQDRLNEKQFFTRLAIPTPKFYPANDAEQLSAALREHREPLLVKSRRWGYDGKGQSRLSTATEVAEVWKHLGNKALLAEELIHFTREVSLIAVRGTHGEIAFYPLAENVHHKGILVSSRPTEDDPMQPMAEDYVTRVLNELDYVGVLGFEFFEYDGQLYANEIAPRVHNSGHWSIEASVTSQFENHLRAILGWPLGSTRLREPCVMYNCIGELPDKSRILQIPHAHLHDYGKTARAGRKLGHITLCDPTAERSAQIESCLPR